MLGFAVCVRDQQRTDAAVFGSGEWAAEEDEALLCERVHEGCLLGHRRAELVGEAATHKGASALRDDFELHLELVDEVELEFAPKARARSRHPY